MKVRFRIAEPSPSNPSLPHRDDCWSDGETETLVGAWGERFLSAHRGVLRQPQWEEVAAAVNTHRSTAGRFPARSHAQCKSRIDTLKKRYKVEKEKIEGSSWKLFPELDRLLRDYVPNSKKLSPSLKNADQEHFLPPSGLAVKYWHPNDAKLPSPPLPPRHHATFDVSVFRQAAAAAAAAAKFNHEDDMQHAKIRASSILPTYASRHAVKRKRGDVHQEEACHELARGINRMAEMLDRVAVGWERFTAESEQRHQELLEEMKVEQTRLLMDAKAQIVSRRSCKRLKREDN